MKENFERPEPESGKQINPDHHFNSFENTKEIEEYFCEVKGNCNKALEDIFVECPEEEKEQFNLLKQHLWKELLENKDVTEIIRTIPEEWESLTIPEKWENLSELCQDILMVLVVIKQEKHEEEDEKRILEDNNGMPDYHA